MKYKVFMTLIGGAAVLISTESFAMINGFYTGVQLGQSKIDVNATSLKVKDLPYLSNGNEVLLQGPSKTKVGNDGFAGRAYAGYQFNQYVSIEGGYTQYANTKISNIYGMTGLDESLHQGALDGVLKFMLPITEQFHLYAKGGGAYVFSQQIQDPTGIPSSSNASQPSSGSYKKVDVDVLRPTYGVGMSYDVTKHLSTDLTWSHVVGGNGIEQSDLLALGVSYYFNPSKSA